MSSAVRYQVMPPLSSEEYQELHDDIKVNGVLEPIHVDEEGVVIDGHHRSKIANELGIPCPVITHDDLDDAGKRSLAFTLNLKRRHLNREQRRALIAESLKADPQLSNREHARRTGASHPTVNTVREELEDRGEVEKFTTSKGGDGKSYPASQPKREPEPAPSSLVGPNERIDDSTIIGTKDLDELNQLPTEQPTMEQPEHKPRAEPITNQFTSAIVDLNRVMAKFHRISENENFPRNKEKVAALHRHDLTRSISELQALADQLN